MIKNISIYISGCHNPYINLATEQDLLNKVKNDEMIMYLWQNQNTVVIGKNQNVWSECNLEKMQTDGIALARRMSGGGAVFHDLGNLNFTFLYSDENEDVCRNMQIIKKACRLADIDTEISGRNDILADGRKFSGNAFYHSKGKAYHHGTVMINADKEKLGLYLTPSKAKLDAKGVKSVRSRVVNLAELNPTLSAESMKLCLIKAFEETMNKKADIYPCTLTDEISSLADLYSSNAHLMDSQPPFKFTCEKRFPWGSVEIMLNIAGGIINEAKVYTDSMDWRLSENTQSALKGCRLDEIDNADISNDIKNLIKESL